MRENIRGRGDRMRKKKRKGGREGERLTFAIRALGILSVVKRKGN